MEKIMFRNKIIVVTGAVGTVGSEIVKLLMRYQPSEIRAFDNNESEVFLLGQKYGHTGMVTTFLGDVRDQNKLEQVFQGADIVFHLAAHKHVYLAEYNPFDTVQTNINGVENVIRAALRNKVKRVLFTSSDKAVNPTSVMGTTKLMGERLITAANLINFKGSTILASSRFGNVLGSRGSVVPIFMEQIKKGGPVTVTDEGMTRFIMSIREAAELVIKSAVLAKGGEVFITKMPVVRIIDLAKAMIELLAPKHGYDPDQIEISLIGAKPGEKMYEELLSMEETCRSVELKDMFVALPAFRSMYRHVEHIYSGLVRERVERSYVSEAERAMPVEEIKALLCSAGLVEDDHMLMNDEIDIAVAAG
ncbi:MAG: polysaccharide biosynthesis protein [Desulfobacterales bacterium]|nr:polysaccharide biosynthesis protein [Desulfobacterales bacterium]